MTRWARGRGKVEHDASSWEDLKTGNHVHKQTKYQQKQTVTNNNIPESLEKRRAARRLRRKKSRPCFHCRKTGHISLECPLKEEGDASNICFKCGSAEHTAHDCKLTSDKGDFPFAKCFICKQNGHLSGTCPDNPRGLYPDGGGCKFCGSVEHYRRDCPEKNGILSKDTASKKRKYKLREENESIDAIINSDDDVDDDSHELQETKKKKLIKF